MGNINTQPLRRGLFNTLMIGALGIENWYDKLGVVCYLAFEFLVGLGTLAIFTSLTVENFILINK